MRGVPIWVPQQDAALTAGWRNPFVSATDIADVLMVTLEAVRGRAAILGLGPKPHSGRPPRLLSRNDDGVSTLFIPGAAGQRVLLDDADVGWFIAFPGGWYAHRDTGGTIYVYTRANPHLKLHRLLLGCSRGVLVDHENGDGLDNRRRNIREATPRQNTHNSRRRDGIRSEYKGVWRHVSGLFGGAVTDSTGRRRSIGYYRTEREAARSHDAAVFLLRGSFAYLNLPDDRMTAEEIAAIPSLYRIAAEVADA